MVCIRASFFLCYQPLSTPQGIRITMNDSLLFVILLCWQTPYEMKWMSTTLYPNWPHCSRPLTIQTLLKRYYGLQTSLSSHPSLTQLLTVMLCLYVNRCLTNLTVDHPENRHLIAESGFLPLLLRLFAFRVQNYKIRPVSTAAIPLDEIPLSLMEYSEKIVKQATKPLRNMFYEGLTE